MENQTKRRVLEITWPLFAGFSFLMKTLHKLFFSWWLDVLLQRKANESLWSDIQTNLHFLLACGQRIQGTHTNILPFDYASVYVASENLLLCFSRGRNDVSLTLAPREMPNESYELAIAIAALDSAEVSEMRQPTSLEEIADILRARWDQLNAAFSKTEYLEFKKALLTVKEHGNIATRQTEWELNKHLYR